MLKLIKQPNKKSKKAHIEIKKEVKKKSGPGALPPASIATSSNADKKDVKIKISLTQAKNTKANT